MAQVVLSLSKESEDRLRRLAQITKQGRKGALSDTVEEAIFLLEKKLKQKASLGRLKTLASQDKVFGAGRFKREEAYA